MKIVVGGQINKQEIHDYIQKYFGEGNVELAVKNDLRCCYSNESRTI